MEAVLIWLVDEILWICMLVVDERGGRNDYGLQ